MCLPLRIISFSNDNTIREKIHFFVSGMAIRELALPQLVSGMAELGNARVGMTIRE